MLGMHDVEDHLPLSSIVGSPRPHLVHPPTSIATFVQTILTFVESWSEDEWCCTMPTELREDIWDGHFRCDKTDPSCSAGNCICPHAYRTPELEMQLFLENVRSPSAYQGPAFFFAAALVFEVGILLIADIVLTAGADDEATHMVYDFGTQHFECSIVVYGLQLPAGSGRLRSSGHYETVGLFPEVVDATGRVVVDTSADPATQFERDHWLLDGLRRTAEHHRRDPMPRHSMAADSSCYAQDWRGPMSTVPSPEQSAATGGDSVSAAPSPAPAAPVDLHTGTRPRRATRRPARYTDGDTDQPLQPPRRSAARRSLQASLDAAAAANVPARRSRAQSAALGSCGCRLCSVLSSLLVSGSARERRTPTASVFPGGRSGSASAAQHTDVDPHQRAHRSPCCSHAQQLCSAVDEPVPIGAAAARGRATAVAHGRGQSRWTRVRALAAARSRVRCTW